MLSINNARSMSLLSPFSLFSPGEGVGSKAVTHQQVPFSPFIISMSSQLPLFSSCPCVPLFSVHLPCVFTSFLLHYCVSLSACLLFPFPTFSSLNLHLLVLSSPLILCLLYLSLLLSLPAFLCFYLTTSNISIVPSWLLIIHSLHSIFTSPL